MLKSSKHKHIGWDKLHSKLEREGYSKESSDKIAGSIKAKVQKAEKEDENEIGTKFVKGEPPPGEIHPKEHVEGEAIAPDKRVEHQMAPGNNPHEQAEGNNPDWGTDPGVKGHIKLAHFMGHRSAKKKHSAAPGMAAQQAAPAGVTKAETGHEKGINTQSDPSQKSRVMMGTSKAGSQMPLSKNPQTRAEDVHDAKNQHKKVLGEMKAQPKPNLTKHAGDGDNGKVVPGMKKGIALS